MRIQMQGWWRILSVAKQANVTPWLNNYKIRALLATKGHLCSSWLCMSRYTTVSRHLFMFCSPHGLSVRSI